MRRIFQPILLGLCAAVIAAPTLALAAEAPDDVVATVNGAPLYRWEIAMMHQALPQRFRKVPLERLFDQLVDRMIDRRLVTQAARRESLHEKPEVKARISFQTDEVLWLEYLKSGVEGQITEARLRQAYDAMVAKKPPQLEVHARHILVKEEKKARDIIRKLNGGAGFGEMARKYSTGPSGAKGGDLGYFTKDQMVPPFAEAAFAMQPGDYSKTPVQTRFGWHVILVEERRQKPPPSFEESEPELKSQLSNTLVGEKVADLRKGAEITKAKAK